MPRLLVVHHSPTPTVQSLTDAVLAGAHDDAIEGVEVVVPVWQSHPRCPHLRSCGGPARSAGTDNHAFAGLPGRSTNPQPVAPNCSTRIQSARMPDSPSSRRAYDANPTEPQT